METENPKRDQILILTINLINNTSEHIDKRLINYCQQTIAYLTNRSFRGFYNLYNFDVLVERAIYNTYHQKIRNLLLYRMLSASREILFDDLGYSVDDIFTELYKNFKEALRRYILFYGNDNTPNTLSINLMVKKIKLIHDNVFYNDTIHENFLLIAKQTMDLIPRDEIPRNIYMTIESCVSRYSHIIMSFIENKLLKYNNTIIQQYYQMIGLRDCDILYNINFDVLLNDNLKSKLNMMSYEIAFNNREHVYNDAHKVANHIILTFG